MELHNSTSTQSLGVNSTSGESIVFSKGNKRLVVAAIIACVFLLVACVILSVLYAKQITNPNKKVNNDTVNGKTTPIPFTDACITSDCLKVAAVLTKNINKSVDPCEDFYHYACDGWIRDNPIPPSENEYATFFQTDKKTKEKLRSILEEATYLKEGSPLRKTRDYYVSCMDEREVDRAATDQMKKLIRSFGSWALDSTWNETSWEWETSLLKIQQVFFGDSPLFTLEVVEDPTNSSKYLLKIHQPNLSLTVKERYSNRTKHKKVIDAYLEFMTKVGVLLADSNVNVSQEMRDVFEFEAKLAEISLSKSVYIKHIYDTYELKTFNATASSPDFSWITYLNQLFKIYNITLDPNELIIVSSQSYLANMTKLVASQSKRTLSNYFGWVIVRKLIPYLSTPFREALLEYKTKATKTMASKPRWMQCIAAIDDRKGLSFALGYLYIQKAFDKSLIPLLKSMMGNMRKAFREEVKSLSWIDETTRRGVFDKEEGMIEKIGFPQLCVNYSLLENYYSNVIINEKQYLLNQVNISKWYTTKVLSSLRNSVDRDAWYSGPQMVNAFYLRERNEINIMAGILQPPFFYGKEAPRVVNYGGIGMVLAHELTHGFDSAGRRFNKYGEIRKNLGWTNNSMDEFTKRAECIVDQYDKYEIKIDKGSTIHVNGKLTLDENIADNGGFRIAFRAYEDWSKKHGPEKVLPGLKKTNQQIFFISYAQMWCSVFSPPAAFSRAQVDTHSNPKYRVIGVMSNSEAFSEAFNCPVGSKMNPGPSKRCRVW